MPEGRQYIFTAEKMVILESAQDGLLYSNLLLESIAPGGIWSGKFGCSYLFICPVYRCDHK